MSEECHPAGTGAARNKIPPFSFENIFYLGLKYAPEGRGSFKGMKYRLGAPKKSAKPWRESERHSLTKSK